MDGGNELAWVRIELDILASSRSKAPLTPPEEARYAALVRRERELLGAGPHPATAAPAP